jgi:excisionase family DNA binding protein
MMGRKEKKHEGERVLDVDAAMQGSLIFKDPVNLRINGRFEGVLNTKGNLMIGEHSVVDADIVGESIVIAGKVNGTVHALKDLKLIAPACVTGNVKTPLLSVAEGAILEGNCKMLSLSAGEMSARAILMTQEELAKYLEVDQSLVSEWANIGRLPSIKDGSSFKFDRVRIDEWVAAGKIK